MQNLDHPSENFNDQDALALARQMANDPRASEAHCSFGRVAAALLTRYQQAPSALNAARSQVLAERLAKASPGPILAAHWPMDGE